MHLTLPGQVAVVTARAKASDYTPAPPEAIGPPLLYLTGLRAEFTGKIVRRTAFVNGEFVAVRP